MVNDKKALPESQIGVKLSPFIPNTFWTKLKILIFQKLNIKEIR